MSRVACRAGTRSSHDRTAERHWASDTDGVDGSADERRIDRQARVERVELAPHSWVQVVRGFVRDADAAFTELHDSLDWQQTEVLRYDHYVPENRLGVGVRTDAYPLFRQTDLHLRSLFRVQFTGEIGRAHV